MDKKIIFKLKNGKEIILENEEIKELYEELHDLMGKKEVEYKSIDWNKISYTPPLRITYSTDTSDDKISIKPHITIT